MAHLAEKRATHAVSLQQHVPPYCVQHSGWHVLMSRDARWDLCSLSHFCFKDLAFLNETLATLHIFCNI